MVTKGNTSPILVQDGLAAYLKSIKKAGGAPIWSQVQDALSPEFVKQYNEWVERNPEGHKYEVIKKNGKW